MADKPLQFQLKGSREVQKWFKAWSPPPNTRRQMLVKVRAFMNKVIGIQFVKNRRGGSSRGVTWPGFADQYTRTTDGKTVPAEGGVSRIRPAWRPRGVKRGRTSGSVLGKLRPSGRRITNSSNLMQDIGVLRATRAQINFLSPNKIQFGPTVPYAEAQNKMRPFAFFESPKDGDGSLAVAFKTYSDYLNSLP